MRYSYKSEIKYLYILIVIGIFSLIGYLVELSYSELVLLDIFILSFLVIISFMYSDYEFVLDSEDNILIHRYIKFARLKERTFLLREVSYEYKSVFINGGVSDRLKIIVKNKTVIQPVANIYSLSSIQLDSLVAKMKELGVKGENKV